MMIAEQMAEEFERPAHAHRPGENARPHGGMVEVVAHAAHEADDLKAPAICHAWRYGLFLLREGFYWEAHEVLEPVWMAAPPNSRERALVQGVIQLANAALKASMSRDNAARRLSVIALTHLEDAAPAGALLGVSTSRLRDMAVDFDRALHNGADWSHSLQCKI